MIDALNDFGLSAYTNSRFALSGLGAVTDLSAESSVDVAIAVGETRVLMALAAELAKIDYATYQKRVTQIQSLVAAVGDLNRQIATLNPAGKDAWALALDHANEEMDSLEQQLHADLAAARRRRDFLAVGLTAGSLLLAGIGGWYVFSHRQKKKFA